MSTFTAGLCKIEKTVILGWKSHKSKAQSSGVCIQIKKKVIGISPSFILWIRKSRNGKFKITYIYFEFFFTVKTNFWESTDFLNLCTLNVILWLLVTFGGQGLLFCGFFWGPKPFYIFIYLISAPIRRKFAQDGNPVGCLMVQSVPVLPGSPVGHHEGSHTAHQVVDCRGLEVQFPIHDPSGWVYPNCHLLESPM